MAATEPEWTLGDRLRKARETANLTREDMAAKLGVNKANVWNWENDVSRPRDVLEVTYEWAHITGVHLEWLRGSRSSPHPKVGGEQGSTDNPGSPDSHSYPDFADVPDSSDFRELVLTAAGR